MLTPEIVKKIESFVAKEPRSVDNVAKAIGKNWRTADRYVKEIEESYGTVSTKVFREGTRGALKVVFWSSMEKASSSVFQEALENEIMRGKKKEDFSEFDIFQHVPDARKVASVELASNEDSTDLSQLATIIGNTKKQLLIFSGNLSFINLKSKKIDIFHEFDALIKRGVQVRVVCRVDLAGKENVEKLLSLNFKNGKELIEVRHREQPLCGMISDGTVIRIKEVKEPTGKIHELNKRTFIFYTIRDKSWAEWLAKIFWKMFTTCVGSNRRIEEMRKLK